MTFESDVWQFLKEQWRRGTSCDVQIKGPSKTLHAHSFVLATVSPYFKTLLYGPMRGSKTNNTVLADLSAFLDNSLELLLKLIYEDEGCFNNNNDISDFLLLLDYLQIDSYFNDIWKVMIDYISFENCLQLFDLTSRCNMKYICDSLVLYIGHHFVDLIESQSWSDTPKDIFISLIGHEIIRALPVRLLMKACALLQNAFQLYLPLMLMPEN